VNPLEWTAEERRSLDALHPEARPHFEHLVEEARRRGHHVYLSSVVRTLEGQGGLHDSGQSRARCSWHPLGRAVDLDLDGNVTDREPYERLGEWWKAHGGTWGGDFSGYGALGDFVHYQWASSRVPPEGLCDAAGVAAYWAAADGSAAGSSPQSSRGAGVVVVVGFLGVAWLVRKLRS
jgi:hypothetical protein